jgi:hypothetical protein
MEYTCQVHYGRSKRGRLKLEEITGRNEIKKKNCLRFLLPVASYKVSINFDTSTYFSFTLR